MIVTRTPDVKEVDIKPLELYFVWEGAVSLPRALCDGAFASDLSW
jgi:hypothetical protein